MPGRRSAEIFVSRRVASRRVRTAEWIYASVCECLTAAGSIEDTVDLESIGCRITLRDSYERVEFSS